MTRTAEQEAIIWKTKSLKSRLGLMNEEKTYFNSFILLIIYYLINLVIIEMLYLLKRKEFQPKNIFFIE